ncbi:uncharacterized protein LOC118185583 [Stegodyphus dumicola]|uniref:uncharacterized protein LOC118185583 n=1 Tax=Stegodyphus dumicola TaxID=202533 RepID=UPI0015A97874|nr:uncharacterized protein LOC118185583 [Stegodyphus dumicola]
MFEVAKECIQTVEKECQTKEDPNLKDFISVVEDVCKEGSERNKKFIKNFPCFGETIENSSSCVASIVKDVTPETAQDPEKVKEITKTVCKQMDSIVTCFEKKVEDACSKDVKKFFQELYNPALKVVKNSCEKILNDDASSSRAVSWLVNLSVLVFLFFWYSRR